MSTFFYTRKGWKVAVLLGAAVTLILIQLNAPFTTRFTTGIEQRRYNKSARVIIPNGDHILTQTFTSRQSGLSEVEIKFGRTSANNPGDQGNLRLNLTNAAETVIYQETLAIETIRDGDTHVLAFDPQPDSAGQTYQLSVTGRNNSAVSLCAYSLSALADATYAVSNSSVASDSAPNREEVGQLNCGRASGELASAGFSEGMLSEPAQTSYLVTRSKLTVGVAVREIGRLLRTHAVLMIMMLIIIPAPGMIIAARRISLINLSLAMVCGIAVWTLIWLWWSLIAPLPVPILWLIVIIGWVAAIWKRLTADHSPLTLHYSPFTILLLLILLLTLFTRLLTIRSLLFPPWVDSSHHALITQVMVETQRMLRDFQPLIDFSRPPLYHTGLYPLPTTLSLMLKSDLPRLLLILGQLFSTLIPLTAYAGTLMITKRRTISVLTAFIVALPAFFPGYYVAWGRLTQLTGMLLLPLLMGVTWQASQLHPDDPDNNRAKWSMAGATGLLAAALFLIHVRVFIFYLPFALTAWAWHKFRGTRTLFAAGFLALLIAFPRIIQLAIRTGRIETLAAPASSGTGSLNFPSTYFALPSEQFLLIGVVIVTLFALLALRWHKTIPPWVELVLVSLMWAIPLLVLPLVPNVPRSWVLDYHSHYIMLYLPSAMLIAAGLSALWAWGSKDHADQMRPETRIAWAGIVGRIMMACLFGAALAYTGVYGIQRQSHIVGDRTILARPPDQAAIAWLQTANLPADTLIANESWSWLNGTWAAEDGSAWILPLTGHKTTTPPHDYETDLLYREWVPRFNKEAEGITDWSTDASADFLRENGVTHVYVGGSTGSRGINFSPAGLNRNQHMRLIYQHDGAFIFELIR